MNERHCSDMVATAKRIMELPVDIWVSGHWRYVITEDIQQKIKSFIHQINMRDAKLLAYLQTPKFIGAMAAKDLVLPASIVKESWLMQAMEKRMITMHLNKLQKQGKVQRTFAGKWVQKG